MSFYVFYKKCTKFDNKYILNNINTYLRNKKLNLVLKLYKSYITKRILNLNKLIF